MPLAVDISDVPAAYLRRAVNKRAMEHAHYERP